MKFTHLLKRKTAQESIATKCNVEKSDVKGKTRVYNLVILDESGSMGSIRNAAIQGFNETLGGIRSAQEKFKETQVHFVSLLTFCSCKKKMIYDKIPVEKVPNLTTKEYSPCCGTPLYDAMGFSLNALEHEIKDMEDATAMVTIITDGMENSSREYSGASIKALVDRLTNEEGWVFSYIGTNQDVQAVSASLNITNFMFFQDNEEDMKRAWRSEQHAKMRHFECMEEAAPELACMSASERKSRRAKMNNSRAFFVDLQTVEERITPKVVKTLAPNEVFVFGSNTNGGHSGGAAWAAVSQFGAKVGQGEGLQGQSYAIPTVGCTIRETQAAIERFVEFAKQNPDLKFFVTRIGCGHGSHSVEEMADMFTYAVNCPNICLPKDFWKYVI